ncbi:MAG: sulfatase-like hydrolase/transferase, partial [Candidatus Margulisbacteria bacterium]|nr:sulfatase-like hydrolase/transferase [Candidatus Margulisiibacteriota bacterium]
MKKGKNVILITLDCVRPEALGCYRANFKKRFFFKFWNKTPSIDSLARDGILFEQAICQAPFTPASHASILTGLNPYNHGIREMIGSKLSGLNKVKTLAEVLKNNNYQTAAFIGSHALGSEYG